MLVSLNGKLTPPDAATVSIFDRGLLFGDAIYEVVRTWDRRPFHLREHLDRLTRSGAAIGLDVRPLRPALEAEVARMAAEHPGSDDLVVRLMVTTGTSPNLDLVAVHGAPTWIVWAKPIEPFNPRFVEEGLRLGSVTPDEVVGRIAPGVKSNNRQANVMAHRLARSRGHDDALFVDPAGAITEGPTWNVFCVLGGGAGEVRTPPLEGGILGGITRALVLELCRELGVPARETAVSLAEARASDEMFLTSTTRGVMPVAALDGAPLRAAAPGPVTRRLRDALRERARRGA